MANADAEVWLIRGEAGDITPMSPPLGEGIAQRLRTGALVRVNPDGSRWEAPAHQPAAPPGSLVEKRADEAKAEAAKNDVLMPALGAPKAQWVLYAASTGRITPDAAEDLTKDELIVRFGEQPEPSSRPRPKRVDTDGDDADLGPVRPAQNAPKAQWVLFAELVSDLSHDEALALTKAELVERFGS